MQTQAGHLDLPHDRMSDLDAVSSPISGRSRRRRHQDCKFYDSALYKVMTKEGIELTESDVKDLRLIIQEFDFIKNHEL